MLKGNGVPPITGSWNDDEYNNPEHLYEIL